MEITYVNRLSKIPSVAALTLSVFLSSHSSAQNTTTAEGVFTLEQASAGEVTYNASCKTCHDIKFYRDIWSYWEQRSLEGFWSRIVSEMPSENPGSLLDEEYTNIVAFILSDLGYPAGNSVLDPYNGMAEITIAPRK
ncbi:MAG: hypothetical protein ACI95C_000650 [Pseudohongiellaceae bacterium]